MTTTAIRCANCKAPNRHHQQIVIIIIIIIKSYTKYSKNRKIQTHKEKLKPLYNNEVHAINY